MGIGKQWPIVQRPGYSENWRQSMNGDGNGRQTMGDGHQYLRLTTVMLPENNYIVRTTLLGQVWVSQVGLMSGPGPEVQSSHIEGLRESTDLSMEQELADVHNRAVARFMRTGKVTLW